MLTPFLISHNCWRYGFNHSGCWRYLWNFGVLALTIGGILGVLSFQRWIRKMDVTMILAMHLPIIGFILLSHFHPVPFSIFMQQ
jgi:PAT family beta-lactamase induction signal transducer AmpG